MRIVLISILFYFLVPRAFSIECKGTSGIQKELNLRAPGKSFEKFRTYDQGDIGSCANNSLATLLYSQKKLQVSPNQLHASYYSAPSSIKEKIMGGASVCTSFNRSKRYLKKICSSSSVKLDQTNREGMDTALQAMGFIYSSFYGEGIDSGLTKEELLTDLYAHLEKIDEMRRKEKQECDSLHDKYVDEVFYRQFQRKELQSGFYGAMKTKMIEINDFIEGTLSKEDIGMGDDPRSEKELKEKFKAELPSICDMNKCDPGAEDFYSFADMPFLCIDDGEDKHFCTAFKKDIEINIREAYQNIDAGQDSKQEVQKIFSPGSLGKAPLVKKTLLNTLFKNKNNTMKPSKNLYEDFFYNDLNYIDPQSLSTKEVLCDEHVKFNLDKKMTKYADDSMSSNKSGQCDQSDELLLSVIESLKNVSVLAGGELFVKSVLDTIQNKQRFSNVFNELMVDQEECNKEENHISREELSSLKCNRFSNTIDENDPEEREKQITEKNEELVERFSRNLGEGRPVGISYCTGFFRDLNDSMDYRLKNCDPDKNHRHGKHASAIIGERCKNGKREYLIQNSWGNQCDSYKSLDCNAKQGTIWVPQDVLFPNIFESQVLK